jgi:tripartite-type tricarboxylate transporter receptor subunit TctC
MTGLIQKHSAFAASMGLVRQAFGAALIGMAGMAAAIAQDFPNKPVRIIIPFAPGGSGDIIGRIYGEKLAREFRQPVLIDNRAGAGGNLASEVVAKSAPDGYTLLLAATSHVTNGALYANLPYDPIKDFSPISEVAYYPLLLVVNPSVPANTVRQLIDYAKANPGKLTFGSAGSGTPTHLANELFRRAAGIDFLHIPYKGAAPATNDLLGGQIQAMFTNPVSALPQIAAGKLKALATTGAKRSAFAPTIPTIAESGIKDFEAGTWFALLGPARMSKEIVDRIANSVRTAARMPDLARQFQGQGVEPRSTTPQELAVIMHDDSVKWGRVIRDAGIKPD